ncbi:MAG: phosphopyruvate hydratase [Bacteriovoracales bacterium]|nr:phosphopyruvate hydratase [Bacteriovoracales bacterium]
MSVIRSLRAREILDSRGHPTVEVELETDKGVKARASVPSGASTGRHEAHELRDGDPKRFGGRGVLKACQNVEGSLARALIGRKTGDGPAIDRHMIELDGTDQKERLGANAILAVSLACAKAGARERGWELFRYLREGLGCPMGAKSMILPAPLMNIINGGRHGANNLDIQEFMIVPHLKTSFRENLRACVEIFHELGKLLSMASLSTNVGDEGGFAPSLKNHEEALGLILKAIEKAGYRPGEDISLALDCAASEFYRDGRYVLEGRPLDSNEMIDYLESLSSRYPINSIEDGLAEDDHDGWKKMTTRLAQKVLLIGDDLFVTNPKILKKGIEEGEANAILIKPNQIGTLTETFRAMAFAFDHGYKAVVSHRSGETGESFIADLAVATACGRIKAGSASRSDRVEKYNRLLRIEEELGGEYSFILGRS